MAPTFFTEAKLTDDHLWIPEPLNHRHLLLKAYLRRAPERPSELNQWLEALVASIDMKVFMDAKSAVCVNPGNKGITGVIGLETSHCSAHFWTEGEFPLLQFDLYSCRDFDTQTVIGALDAFGLICYTFSLYDRNEGVAEIDSGFVTAASIISLLDEDEQTLFNAYCRGERNEFSRAANNKYERLRRRYSSSAHAWKKSFRDTHVNTIKQVKERARAKGLQFDLTTDWYESELTKAKERWPLLVAHPQEPATCFWGAEIDRKKPELGYTQSNCRIVPRALNLAKSCWSDDQLRVLAVLLVDETKTPIITLNDLDMANIETAQRQVQQALNDPNTQIDVTTRSTSAPEK